MNDGEWNVWFFEEGFLGAGKGNAWRGDWMEHLAKPSEGEMKYVDENCQDISEFKGERKITKYGQQKNQSKKELNKRQINHWW